MKWDTIFPVAWDIFSTFFEKRKYSLACLVRRCDCDTLDSMSPPRPEASGTGHSTGASYPSSCSGPSVTTFPISVRTCGSLSLWCPVGTGYPETRSPMTHHQLPQTENTRELVTEALVSGPSVGQRKRKHVRQEGKKGSCGQMHEEVADVSQNCRGDFESLRPWRGEGSRYSVDRPSWQQHEGWVPGRFAQDIIQWQLGSGSKI